MKYPPMKNSKKGSDALNCLLIMPDMRGSVNMAEPFLLGICYISAALKQVEGLNLVNLNLNQFDGDKRSTIISLIKEHSIDAVLAGGICTLFDGLQEIFEIVKTYDPDLVTVAGGGIISGDPPAAMEALEYVDYGIIGEGEITVSELCLALKESRDCARVAGLIIREDDGSIFQTEPRAEVSDLGQLPWCDYEGFNFGRYLEKWSDVLLKNHAFWMTKPSLSMLTSRSCPHHCTFCFHPEGIKFRQRDLDDVFAEMDHLLSTYKVNEICFVDEMIGLSSAKLQDFCVRIARYNISWYSSFRVTDVTVEKVRLMKQAGCVGLGLGLESASDFILGSMKKGTTVAQIEKALRICAEERMMICGNFIFGDPEESLESARETLNWYLEHPQYNISLNMMLIFPGTEVYWRAVREGKIKDRAAYLRNNAMAINCTRMTDEQYFHLANNLIPETVRLRFQRLPEIKGAVMRADDEGRLNLSGRCAVCDAELLFEPVTIVARQRPFLCKECATLQTASVLKQIDRRIRSNVNHLVDQYGEIAFWGIGWLFREGVDPEMFENPAVHLIDAHNRADFGGKRIETPDIIAEKQIGLVVISALGNARAATGTAGSIRAAALDLGVTDFIDFDDLWAFDLTDEDRIIRIVPDRLSA